MTDIDTGARLPKGHCLIHIGPQKTGTTAVQTSLYRASDELRESGVRYWGRADHGGARAGWALGLLGRPHWMTQPPFKYWRRWAEQVARSEGERICVSNEDFGRADLSQARRIVSDLGGDNVHVIAVARALHRYLPSQWQQRVKEGVVIPWDEWLHIVLDHEGPHNHYEHANVWRAHDIERLVARWTAVIGADRFTLVINNDHDRDMLPRTFEHYLGLGVGGLQPEPATSNRSLDWPETELARRAQMALASQRVTAVRRHFLMKTTIIPLLQATARETTVARTPPLPGWAQDRVHEIGSRMATAIKAMSVRVVGDPQALVPEPTYAPTADLTTPPIPVESAAVIAEAMADQTGLGTGHIPAAARVLRNLLWTAERQVRMSSTYVE